MTLIERIKSDRMQSRKSRDPVKLQILTTLLGECERVSKEPDDSQVIKVINKSIQGNMERITQIKVANVDSYNLKLENELLESYLPKMLTDEELEREISSLLMNSGVNFTLGATMKYLKDNYPGRYDGKKANEIYKSKTS